MANHYDNGKSVSLTTTLADIYTCPASTETIVLGIQVTNIDGTNSADADVAWTDSSDSDAVTYLIKSAAVAAGQAIPALVSQQVLSAGDKIQAKASAASDLCISVSVLEIT